MEIFTSPSLCWNWPDAQADTQYGHVHSISIGNIFNINEDAKMAEDIKQGRSEGVVF